MAKTLFLGYTYLNLTKCQHNVDILTDSDTYNYADILSDSNTYMNPTKCQHKF